MKSRTPKRCFSLSLLRLAAHCSLFAALLGASCGIDEGEPTLVDRPRVLAIKAEPPQISPGGESKLTALVGLPDDPAPPPTPPLLMWGLCDLSGDVAGQGCSDPEDARALGIGALDDALPLLDPTPETGASFSLPRNFLVGLFARVGENELKAFKRFVVDTSENPNRNPSIASVLIDGEPLDRAPTVEPGRTYSFEVQIPDEARQAYVDRSPSGGGREKTEELFVSWFSGAEGFAKDRSLRSPFANDWTAPKETPAAGKVSFFLVLHDGREGVDWKTFALNY